ncbi:MAG: ABC transporter permease [Succinivibrio sp.]|nr:ABC transporter permease [Succinivibrio sp.]
MYELVKKLLPHVADKTDELIYSVYQTLVMLTVSGLISFVLGLLLGIVLVVTREGGILPHRPVNAALGFTVNLFRSIPFVILLAALIPLSRLLTGTAIGTTGAMVPLIFGTVPFFSRQVETALSGVDHGLIEAAQSMGLSAPGIIVRVLLRESIPQLIRVSQITSISLIGLTAMAGAIGGGGLGDFAIRYGHQRGQTDVTYITVVVILLMVAIIQHLGNLVIKKNTH